MIVTSAPTHTNLGFEPTAMLGTGPGRRPRPRHDTPTRVHIGVVATPPLRGGGS